LWAAAGGYLLIWEPGSQGYDLGSPADVGLGPQPVERRNLAGAGLSSAVQ
jgi:hypothetical protein